jgi:protein phosphatase
VRLEALGRTDTGLVREKNEDRGFIGQRLFVVADGLGGHAGGEVASAMLVERLEPLDTLPVLDHAHAAAVLTESVKDANRLIRERSLHEAALKGMGTTCTIALRVGEDQLVLAQVGDSSAYLLRGDGQLQRITPDHSFVGALVEAGYITEDQARTHPQRSVILRAIGLEPDVEVDVGEPLALEDGDVVVLVSDGVSGVVTTEQLTAIVRSDSLEQTVDAIIDAAKAGGGPDNITVVLIHVHAD